MYPMKITRIVIIIWIVIYELLYIVIRVHKGVIKIRMAAITYC